MPMTIPKLAANSWEDILTGLKGLAAAWLDERNNHIRTASEIEFDNQVHAGILRGAGIVTDLAYISKCLYCENNRISIATRIEEVAIKYASDRGYHFGLGTVAHILRDAVPYPYARAIIDLGKVS